MNVLDEVYNPNLREAIKTYSQWPTIPQVSFCMMSRLGICGRGTSAPAALLVVC